MKNPMSVIMECLTNKTWGRGVDPEAIDREAFEQLEWSEINIPKIDYAEEVKKQHEHIAANPNGDCDLDHFSADRPKGMPLVTPEQRERLQSAMDDIEKNTGVDSVVVTINPKIGSEGGPSIFDDHYHFLNTDKPSSGKPTPEQLAVETIRAKVGELNEAIQQGEKLGLTIRLSSRDDWPTSLRPTLTATITKAL